MTPLTATRFHSTLLTGADNALGKVYTYAAGTTTPQATYTTAAGITPNANPVILDSTGRATIYLDPSLSYKFVIQDALGVATPDGTVDNWTPPETAAGRVTRLRVATGAVSATLDAVLDWQSISALEFMTTAQRADVTGNTGSLDVTTAVQAAFTAAALAGKHVVFPAGTYRLTSLVTVPATVSFTGAGIGVTNFNQVTADTGAFKWADASLAYLGCGGFTLTGAGRGAASSIGIEMGRATQGTFYCRLHDVEVTGFGAAQIRVINGYRCHLDQIYPHGDPTGVASAAVLGLHLLGTFAFAGSNYDNRIGYVEAYNNETDIKVELGGKNNFDRVYTYNQLYTGTVHHIWELDSSLNSWHRPHIEPLSLSAGGTAMWLIESTASNPYTDMRGPHVSEFEYENGTLATTTDVVQIGTGAGSTVYGTKFTDGKFMPVSAGKYHVKMTNESATMLLGNESRNNNRAFDKIIRELTISNPNAATNHSFIGSYYEQTKPESFTATIFAGSGSLGTLTSAYALWWRSGAGVEFKLDTTLSAKTANTGNVTIRGLEALSPNAGTTVFTAVTGGLIPVTCALYDGSFVLQAFNAYLDVSTMYISLRDNASGALATHGAFANTYRLIVSGSFPVA